jgi:site-specific recombinase XerD
MGRKDPVKFLRETITPTTPIGTVLPFRAAIKHYMMAAQGLTAEEAEEKLPKAKGRPAKLRDSLTPDELAAYRRRAAQLPDPAMTILLLLPETGMRIREVCDLRTDDLAEKQGIRGFLFRGKGDKQRFIPLSKAAQEIMEQFMENAHLGLEWLFTTSRGTPLQPSGVRYHTRRMQKDTPELSKLTPHLLRHTFATNALRKGMDLRSLQVLMGHTSIHTTARYLHPDAQMLFDAISLLEE